MDNYQLILTISYIVAAIGAINWMLTINGYNIVDSIAGAGTSLAKGLYYIIGIAGVIVLYKVVNHQLKQQ